MTIHQLKPGREKELGFGVAQKIFDLLLDISKTDSHPLAPTGPTPTDSVYGHLSEALYILLRQLGATDIKLVQDFMGDGSPAEETIQMAKEEGDA